MKKKKTPTQLEQLFLMLWGKDKLRAWPVMEKLFLKQIKPDRVVELLLKGKGEPNLLKFLNLVYDGHKELQWLLKDMYLCERGSEPSQAIEEALDYMATYNN
ncbi:MAG: hypothetical protein Q7K40_03540 [bacterium]|nr:hypothetical protein [bacterium]